MYFDHPHGPRGTNVEILFPANFPGAIAVHPPSALVCWVDVVLLPDDLVFGIVCDTVGPDAKQLVVEESDVRALAMTR